tara:strand:- start:421 stop:1497 length:1077 start_codon:yes stop_codon:yes gene_type:complete
MGEEKYRYPIALTQQFRFCGNSFRVDTYKGCDFGCKYCFANTGFRELLEKTWLVSDIDIIKDYFKKAFSSKYTDSKNLTVELLNRKVPLHLGGMSDPFQDREWKEGVTKQFLEITKEYNYPVMISTKTGHIPDEYFDILDPEIHAFQVSLIGYDDDYVNDFEKYRYSPQERIEFIKKLKSKGFWVSLRIQPLISVDQAIKLIKALEGHIDYVTVEHLKMYTTFKDRLAKYVVKYLGQDAGLFKMADTSFKLPRYKMKENIEKIKKSTDIKIGCGDNEFHEMSDSLNCCGLDTINDNFSNWLKYNSQYINMTGDKDVWSPKSNCSSCLFQSVRREGNKYKDYVDEYMQGVKGGSKDTLI